MTYIGFIFKNCTGKIVSRILKEEKKDDPHPKGFVLIKSVDFCTSIENINYESRKLISDFLDKSDIEHYYAVIYKSNDGISMNIYKNQNEFENINVLDVKVFQQMSYESVCFKAQTWFSNKKLEDFPQEPKKIESVSYIENIENIKSDDSGFKSCDIVRHFDDVGHGHIGIILSVQDEHAKILMLSTSPCWSSFYRQIKNFEQDVIENLVFGRLTPKRSITFLCRVHRMIPLLDLTILVKSRIVPSVIEDIVHEFVSAKSYI
jgi:hypothetical protein